MPDQEEQARNGIRWLDTLWRRAFIPRQSSKERVFFQELLAAKREWRYAEQYFNQVTDPDLIDIAISYLSVAEKKYLFILKQARETGFHSMPNNDDERIYPFLH